MTTAILTDAGHRAAMTVREDVVCCGKCTAVMGDIIRPKYGMRGISVRGKHHNVFHIYGSIVEAPCRHCDTWNMGNLGS